MARIIYTIGAASECLSRGHALMRDGEWLVWDGQGWHRAWSQDAVILDASNLALIRQMLAEYKEHKNDPYAYDPREIDAVRELESNAEKHMEFLLYILDKNKAAR